MQETDALTRITLKSCSTTNLHGAGNGTRERIDNIKHHIALLLGLMLKPKALHLFANVWTLLVIIRRVDPFTAYVADLVRGGFLYCFPCIHWLFLFSFLILYQKSSKSKLYSSPSRIWRERHLYLAKGKYTLKCPGCWTMKSRMADNEWQLKTKTLNYIIIYFIVNCQSWQNIEEKLVSINDLD